MSLFHKQNARIVRRPVINNFLELKTGFRYFVNQDFLLDAVILAILRHAFHLTVLRMRRKIDDRQFSARLQRANQARVKLQRLRQMMVDAPQENRIATRRGQIRFHLPALYHDQVLQIPFFDFGSQRLDFLFVNLRRKQFSRCPDLLHGSECVASISRPNVRDNRSRLPLHKRRELRDFIRGRSLCMQREHKSRHCYATQSKQKPYFPADFSVHGNFTHSRIFVAVWQSTAHSSPMSSSQRAGFSAMNFASICSHSLDARSITLILFSCSQSMPPRKFADSPTTTTPIPN